MHFSHEIFHITAVFNEISVAALFLHIVNLKDWKNHVSPLSKSKAGTFEAESLRVQARALGPSYERAVKAAIENDVNWLAKLPWISGALTLLSMFLTSVELEWIPESHYRTIGVLILSILGLIAALWCVAIHEKSKTAKKSQEQVLNNFTPPTV